MKIGYARVSTLEQNLDIQIDSLKKAGCEKIITDKLTGSVSDRPGLLKLKEILRKDDTLIAYSLDRIGRSVPHLLNFFAYLEEVGVEFISLKEQIDTTTAFGKFIFYIRAVLSELEKDLSKERCAAGRMAARVRGKLVGRPSSLKPYQKAAALEMYEKKEKSVEEICKEVGVSRPTLYKYIRGAENIDFRYNVK